MSQLGLFAPRPAQERPAWLTLGHRATGCVTPERIGVPGGPWWWASADGRWGGPCATHTEAWAAMRGAG